MEILRFYEKKSFKEHCQDAIDELDVGLDRVEVAVNRSRKERDLNKLDQQILQVGWPHIHGYLGETFYDNEWHRAEELVGATETEIEDAIQNLELNHYLDDRQIEILQAGWPLEHGDIGEPFIDPLEPVRPQSQEEELEPVREFEPTRKTGGPVKKEKGDAGVRYPSGRYSKGTTKVHRYEKDVYGKDFYDYSNIAMQKTGSSRKEVETAVERVYDKRSLSQRQSNILQAGWPHIYGKPGTTFKLPNTFSENFIFEIFQELPNYKQKQIEKLTNEYLALKKQIDRFKRPLQSKTKLENNLAAVQDKIIEFMKRNDLTKHTVKRKRWSLRKVPNYYIATNQERAIAALKRNRLSRFVKSVEKIDFKELKKYLKKNPGMRIPGLKEISNDYSIYVYDLMSENMFNDLEYNTKFDSFYEIPYDPQKANNEQLADDVRLMYAHYATFKDTSGKGIKFTFDEIKDNLKKAMIEIKKRIMANEMNYTFNPQKMTDNSRELYFIVKKLLPKKMQGIGEVEKYSERKKIVIECLDYDNNLERLINYIKEIGNVGHSFNIIVDPNSSDEKHFGWDGDGTDYIKKIETKTDENE